MINEITNYRCKCNKCNHLWTTKTFDVPDKCPKCKRVTWNEGSPPATQIESVQAPQIAKPSDDTQAKLERARAALMSVETKVYAPVAEEIDQWIGWGKEEQTYDDQTGDMRTYRKHIKTGKVRWIDSETALISV